MATEGRTLPPTDRQEERRPEDILTAVRELAETLTAPVREQITDLKGQLAAERLLHAEDRERADRERDRADRRAREAEKQLQDELIEHRRAVSLLAERLAMR
jgi:hypothetical protein